MSLQNETLVPITKVRGWHPCKVSIATIYRWCKTGVKSRASGKNVCLERTQRGGTWYTSREAYERFVKRQNGG